MNGIRSLILAGMMVAVLGSVASAQNVAEERDPFYPSGTRPPAAPVPADLDWGRDPFENPLSGRNPSVRTPSAKTQAAGLTGIIYSKKVRVAIVGGEVVREGGMVAGKRLVDIRRKSIVLMDDAGRYEEIFIQDFAVGR